MADLEINNPEFDIAVEIDGASKTIRVKPEETSDGVPYYSCYTDEAQITQIRLDEEGNWEQMWGELEQADINAIGKVIKEKE